MADLRPQHNEEAVGANHPTKTDVINRAYNVEHAMDGTHTLPKAVDAILSGAPVILTLKGSDGNAYYVKGYPTKA